MSVHNKQLEPSARKLPAAVSKPSTLTNEGAWYVKIISGIAEGFYADDQGNEVQLTNNGAVNAAGGAGDMLAANNLSDVSNAGTALANLGGLSATDIISQVDAEAGTATDAKAWTAERVNQAIQALAPAGGTGEANTASNVGTGIPLFKQKTGLDLEFKTINGTQGLVTENNGVSVVDVRMAIDNLVTETASVSGDFFVFYDQTSGTHKKIDHDNMPGGGSGVSDVAFGVSWNGDTSGAASKNAIYDQIAGMNGLISNNTAKASATLSIDTHSDVDTTTAAPTNGQHLEWDGSNWVPATPAGGSAAVVAASINIPTGGSLSDRIAAATGLPAGWSLVLGNDGSVDSGLTTVGADAADLVIKHESGKSPASIKVMKDFGGIVRQQVTYDPSSGDILESNNYNQVLLKDPESGTKAGTAAFQIIIVVPA